MTGFISGTLYPVSFAQPCLIITVSVSTFSPTTSQFTIGRASGAGFRGIGDVGGAHGQRDAQDHSEQQTHRGLLHGPSGGQ